MGRYRAPRLRRVRAGFGGLPRPGATVGGGDTGAHSGTLHVPLLDRPERQPIPRLRDAPQIFSDRAEGAS